MNESSYNRHKIRERALALKRKPDVLTYYTPVEEAAWFQPGYNLNGVFVNMPAFGPGAGYFRNSFLQKHVQEGQPHGNHVSNYPYFVLRTKKTGDNFIGVVSRQWDIRSPTLIYTRTGYCRASVRNATWIGGQPIPHSTAYQNMKSSALVAIGDSILKEVPQWDVLTDLAELGETGDLFKDGVRFLSGLSRGVLTKNPRVILNAFGVKPTRARRRHVRRTIRREFAAASSFSEGRVRTAASLWLTYRYGVMPMLYSFDDAIRAIHTPHDALKRDFQVTFKDIALVKPKTTVTSPAGPTNNPSDVIFDVTEEVTNEYSYRIRARVDFRKAWANRFGLTPWSIPRVAWELVPFSFVVDWFYDVGGWLQRLDLPSILSTIDLVGTLKDRCTSRVVISNPRQQRASAGNVRYVLGSTTVVGNVSLAEQRTFRREVLSYSSPPPNLEWGLDRWKRQLDTAALMLNRTKFH